MLAQKHSFFKPSAQTLFSDFSCRRFSGRKGAVDQRLAEDMHWPRRAAPGGWTRVTEHVDYFAFLWPLITYETGIGHAK